MIYITWKKSNLFPNWVTFKRKCLSPQEPLDKVSDTKWWWTLYVTLSTIYSKHTTICTSRFCYKLHMWSFSSLVELLSLCCPGSKWSHTAVAWPYILLFYWGMMGNTMGKSIKGHMTRVDRLLVWLPVNSVLGSLAIKYRSSIELIEYLDTSDLNDPGICL